MCQLDMASFKQKIFLLLIALIAALGGILFGYDTGVISGALIFIKPTFHLSTFLTEVTVSSVLLGALIGAIGSGRMTDYYGRRRSLLIAAGGFIIGTLLSSFADSIAILIAGRFIVGLAIGIASFAVPLYLSEIAPTRIRGAIVILNTITVTGGIVLAYLIDYVYAPAGDWRWMFAMGVFPAILLGLGTLLLPRSPRWLIQMGLKEQARITLCKIRGPHEVESELAAIEGVKYTDKTRWIEVWQPKFRAVLLVGILLAVIQQVSGINTILYYAPTIFQYAGFQNSSSEIMATLGMGLTNFVFTIIALFLVDRVGRRKLLLFGLGLMTLSLLVVALNFYAGIHSAITKIITLTSLSVFVAAYALSIGCLFWLIIAEIYPLKIRGLAMSIATTANWTANMIVSLTFLSLMQSLSPTSTFLIFTGSSLLSFLFCYFWVPETKAVSLELIESNLRKGVRLRNLGDTNTLKS